MRLLFDQNLSPDLVYLLRELYPDSSHLHLVARDEAEDIDNLEYARENNYVFVTKDTDYRWLSRRFSFPPKVILITSGNGPTEEILGLLTRNWEEIQEFGRDRARGLIELGSGRGRGYGQG